MTRLVVDLTKTMEPLPVIRGESVKEVVLYSNTAVCSEVIKSAWNAVITSNGRVIITMDPKDLEPREYYVSDTRSFDKV